MNFLHKIYLIYFKRNTYSNFCVLLTASIDPNGCYFLKRSDPKIREQDYIEALKLWLSKTNFPIVFCENSGYDLKNIRALCDKYPGRVEIIQFDGNNYPRHLGKGYGEFRIIEKVMSESKFIKSSENIVKVTGRIFIKNIYELIANYGDENIVEFAREFLNGRLITQIVIFIFKKDFFGFFKINAKEIDDSKNISFEQVFEKTIEDLVNKGFKYKLFEKVKYQGVSGTNNIDYNYNFGYKDVHNIDLLNKIIGKIGQFLKSKTPFLHKILKPFFPDK